MKRLLLTFITGIFCAAAAAAANKPVVINFAAMVGDQAFDCAKSYEGIGTTGSKMTVTDFKFYLQDVKLIDKNGKEIGVALTPDSKFQTEKVVLLDFENATGECRNGTADVNTTIRGTVPDGKYVGLKFAIGVPEEINHVDPTKQPSPLNYTRMLWSWQMGYKFARIDTKTTGRPNGYVLHLGSTGCETDKATEKTTCRNSNRPEFAFPKFDVAKNTVVVDLKALFAGANVDVNKEQTAAGCMSFEGDSDCLPVFKNLGISFEGSSVVPQSFMRLASK